jgi:hypothetical protein
VVLIVILFTLAVIINPLSFLAYVLYTEATNVWF